MLPSCTQLFLPCYPISPSPSPGERAKQYAEVNRVARKENPWAFYVEVDTARSNRAAAADANGGAVPASYFGSLSDTMKARDSFAGRSEGGRVSGAWRSEGGWQPPSCSTL